MTLVEQADWQGPLLWWIGARFDSGNILKTRYQDKRMNPQLPIQVNGEDEWEVEEILACKLVPGSLKYRVRGYDPDLAWYPAWNFVR
jgi:hypothetical protein